MPRPKGSKNKFSRKVEVICKTCLNPFKAIPSNIKRGWSKYCSLKCRPPSFGYKGKIHSMESKKKMSNSHKGKILSRKHIENIKKAHYARSKRTEKIIKCFGCNTEIRVSPGEIKYRKYCSQKCFHEDFGKKITGSNHHLWKGGRNIDKRGYILIYNPSHPHCSIDGYVREHRLVMEKHLGRYLTRKEVVHHRGIKYPIGSIKNKQDNRIENLQLFSNHSKHMQYNHAK